MSPGRTRRSVLLAALTVALGGCLGGGGDDDDTGDGTATPESDTPTATDTPTSETTPVPPSDRQALVEQLPEPSPLANSLAELVAADDRDAKANELDYEFQTSDHSVRVQITLESGTELPDGYRVTIEDTYEGTVHAYVHVDDLVPLAMEERVRIIRPPAESQPHNTS
jgi:hypothetical protein